MGNRYGSGTMTERSPGVWRLRVYLGTDESGHAREVHRTFRGGKKAAGAALAELVNESRDKPARDRRTTLGELLDEWLDGLEGRRQPSTINGYRLKVDGRIRPLLGDIPLEKLSARDLDRAYRAWTDDGLAPATVRQCHAIMHAALHQALKWGWLDRNPAQQASPPTVHKPDLRVPTFEQLNALHRAALEADDAVLAAAIAIAALTGMRRGELVALRWSDVDLVAGMVRIERAITVVKGVTHEGSTKTHQSRRVALDETGVTVFRQRWEAVTELSELAGSPLIDDPYVLSFNANGALPINGDTLSHRFTALCKKVEGRSLKAAKEVGRKATEADRYPFHFHSLRHFSVTTLVAAGVDWRTVAERHGHADATMTLNRYAHALPERDRAAAQILGGVLGQQART